MPQLEIKLQVYLTQNNNPNLYVSLSTILTKFNKNLAEVSGAVRRNSQVKR
jgi:hypothetical protein